MYYLDLHLDLGSSITRNLCQSLVISRETKVFLQFCYGRLGTSLTLTKLKETYGVNQSLGSRDRSQSRS